MIRGDGIEQEKLARALELVRSLHIDSDTDLSPLFESPPPDCDPEILKRLRQMYEAGGWVLVESGLADLPADLRWLFESGAVTIEQLATIHEAFGVTAAADLSAAVGERVLSSLPGLNAEVEAAIATALPSLRASIPRIPLGRATAIAEPILERLRAAPGVAWALPTGSLRRGQDMVGDIEIIAAAADPSGAIETVLGLQEPSDCLHRSARRVYVLSDRVQVGVRLPEPDNAGASLLYLTGSAAHFNALRTHAAAAGWMLTATGLHAGDGTLHPAATEDEIYAALGLPCIPPEIRNGEDEIAVAARGELPTLVARRDIRGDLHMHSTWSDGRDPIGAMVEMCRTLGYEYMAITDHSPHSAASRNLDGRRRAAAGGRDRRAARAACRHRDPARLRGRHPRRRPPRFPRPDSRAFRHRARLAPRARRARARATHEALPDRHAASAGDDDYASDEPGGADASGLRARLRPAVRGGGRDADDPRDRRRAVASRPRRRLARRAVAAGATVAIDSDCHRAEMLERQMHLGIVTARRGWVEPRHVLNARSLDEVRAVIAAKRGSR